MADSDDLWRAITDLRTRISDLEIRLSVPALTPSADLPACRDEDPAQAATLAACYDPPTTSTPTETPSDHHRRQARP